MAHQRLEACTRNSFRTALLILMIARWRSFLINVFAQGAEPKVRFYLSSLLGQLWTTVDCG